MHRNGRGLPGQQVKQGASATSGLHVRKASRPKFILDVGWDILIPPGYSSPGTQTEPGDLPGGGGWRGHWRRRMRGAEGVEEGAGWGHPALPCSTHPSPGTGSACLGRAVPPAARHGHVGLPGLVNTQQKRTGRRSGEGGHQRAHGLRGGQVGSRWLTGRCPRSNLVEAPGRAPPRVHPLHRQRPGCAHEALESVLA